MSPADATAGRLTDLVLKMLNRGQPHGEAMQEQSLRVELSAEAC